MRRSSRPMTVAHLIVGPTGSLVEVRTPDGDAVTTRRVWKDRPDETITAAATRVLNSLGWLVTDPWRETFNNGTHTEHQAPVIR